jgi:hypothetical protein
MNTPLHAQTRLLRGALVVTWLATAMVSAIEWNGQSLELLRQAGLHDADTAHALVGLGVAVDLGIGLALLLRPGLVAYGLALAAMLAMTLVATALLPTLWLHPLGPLLKNVPVAALLVALIRIER